MAAVNLIGSYNYALVALSVLIAIFASYAALDLAGRVTPRAVGLGRFGYWAGPVRWGLAFGPCTTLACWRSSYRFRGLPLADRSAVTARGHSRFGRCPGRGEPTENGAFRALAGSVLMGAGISSMHYIGMAAMRLPAVCGFNSFLVVQSSCSQF